MKKYFMFAICGLFLTLTACGTEGSKTGSAAENTSENATSARVEKLRPEAFMMKFNKAEEALLIDIRTAEETANGSIPGAQFIDFYSEDFKGQVAKLDNTKPVFVYCASGGRSGKSVAVFKKAGFTEIYDLDGGYTDYRISNIGKASE